MENSHIIRAPIRFSKEDFTHCSNWIDIVEYLLDPHTDGDSLSVTSDDIEYLSRLLYLAYNIMGEVIDSSEGSDDVI